MLDFTILAPQTHTTTPQTTVHLVNASSRVQQLALPRVLTHPTHLTPLQRSVCDHPMSGGSPTLFRVDWQLFDFLFLLSTTFRSFFLFGWTLGWVFNKDERFPGITIQGRFFVLLFPCFKRCVSFLFAPS